MEQAVASLEQSTGKPKRKHPGRWKPGESGNPTGCKTNKRVEALFQSMLADAGGVDALSAVDRALMYQACRLMTRSERSQTAEDAVRLANAATRILSEVRRHRPKSEDEDRPFSDYLVFGKPLGPLYGEPARSEPVGESKVGPASGTGGQQPKRAQQARAAA